MTGQRTLPDLINTRMSATRMSLRAMAARAASLGTPISASALSAYATGKRESCPESTRTALANALDVPVEHVAAAANVSYGGIQPGPNLAANPHIQDWLLLIDGRPDAEIRAALDVARATLRMWDAPKPPNP